MFTHSQNLKDVYHKMFHDVFDMDAYLGGIALKVFQTCALDSQIRISESGVQQTMVLTDTWQVTSVDFYGQEGLWRIYSS